MATYWVDNINGSNANSGLSPGTAKQSIDGTTGGLSLLDVKGDILNILDTGTTYDVAATTNLGGGSGSPLAGTSYSDFGAKIQGTDSAGNPRLVRFRFTAAGVSAIGIREGQNFIIVQGLYCDRPNSTAASTTLTFVNVNDSTVGGLIAGPVRVQACVDESSTTRTGAFVRDVSGTLTATGGIEVAYSLIRNWSTNGGISIAGASQKQLLVHHNVWWADLSTATAPTPINLGTNDNSANVDHQVYNNTLICLQGRTGFINSLSTFATGAAGAKKRFHSNIFASFSASASNSDTFIVGAGSWEDQAWTGSVREIGFNVFVDPGGFNFSVSGPYFVPWDPDNSDVPADTNTFFATDTTDVGASADPFHDRLAAFDWTPGGLGYTIPLDGDLRLDEFREAGKDGAVPGAIPDPIAVPSDPPIWDPGPSGLPVGADAPAFAPDGVIVAIRLRRNTVLGLIQRTEGAQEVVTQIGDGMAVVSTNVVAAPVNLLAGSRMFMLETDARITVQLNSATFVLLPDGCFLVDGANLTTFLVSNPSTVKQAMLRFVGAK